MKKNYITIIAALFIGFTAKSQQTVGFEDLTLAADTFWNGSDLSGQFTSNSAVFTNKYSGYWSGGFAYSNMKDDSTAGFTNSYSCIKGEGAGSSSNYAVFTNFDSTAVSIPSGSSFNGFWINNSTYAYLSMKNGDSFAKKFGDSTDASGNIDGTNGEDWFKLTIYGNNSDSVEFYLADFRGASTADYIISDWTYVSLSGLSSSTTQLSFKLSSSDVGAWGTNTPSYFCMDSLTFSAPVSIVENNSNSISTFPNPTTGKTTVRFEEVTSGNYTIYSVAGSVIAQQQFNSVQSINLDLTNQEKGMYILSLNQNGRIVTKRIIKQ